MRNRRLFKLSYPTPLGNIAVPFEQHEVVVIVVLVREENNYKWTL